MFRIEYSHEMSTQRKRAQGNTCAVFAWRLLRQWRLELNDRGKPVVFLFLRQVYETVLAAALSVQGCGARSLALGGPWRWLLKEARPSATALPVALPTLQS